MIGTDLEALLEPLERFESIRRRAARLGGRLADLSYANPYEGAVASAREAIADALRDERELDLQYAPFGGQTLSRRAVADALSESHGLRFGFGDVVLTPGAMSALNLALRAAGGPGDEVVITTPCWLDYPLYARALGMEPVLVPLSGDRFDLDVAAVAASLSERTCALLLCNPENPTGRNHGSETLGALADALSRAEAELGCRITVIADETHRDFVPAAQYTSAASSYDRTLIVYSFGKYHFMQGQRLGYVATSPLHPEREAVGEELVRWTRVTGTATPTALMQRALPRLLSLTHDLAWLEGWRGRLLETLDSAGYVAVEPDATLFVYVRTPPAYQDDFEFITELADNGVLALPAPVFHHQGWFRLSMTGSEQMMEKALPVLTELGPGMKPIRKLGHLDRNFAWDGERLCADDDLKAPNGPSFRLRGSATLVEDDSPPWRIVRDPLGINKLFWAREEDGSVAVAARPRILTEQGHSLGSIRAIPRGCVIDLDSTSSERAAASLVPAAWTDPASEGSVEAAGSRIRRTLDGYLAALASAYPSGRAFICLSGGLDSSVVAVLVREHFPDAVAVSFDLDRAGAASDDRLTASRLARDLGMPLLEATVGPEELLSRLDTVLVEGIDWRDFNVHAGLVNAVLAGAIAEAVDPSREAIVFTGDLANEFLVDYQPETYRGATYYELPELRPKALRSALVNGLDSCHREIGVFGAWGLSLVQPYAVAVDDYLALPEDFLRVDDRKGRLCRAVCGSQVPSYIHSRPKARAQMGGEEVGHSVLAACVDRGVDSQFLRQRFAVLHGVTDPAELDRFVRAGRYRASAPTLASPL